MIKPTPGAGARAGSGETPTSQPLPRRDRVDAPVVRHRSASSLPLDPPWFDAGTGGSEGTRPAYPGRAALV